MAGREVYVDDEHFCVVFKANYRAMKNQIAIYEAYFDKKDEYERTVEIDFHGATLKTEQKRISSDDW